MVWLHMKPALRSLFFCLTLVLPAGANTDVRQWIADGRTFSAELIRYDAGSETVVFRDGEGRDFEMQAAELSITDQAWLEEWTFLADRMAEKVEEIGGELEHFLTKGNYPTDLFIYHPPGVEDPETRPMLILFHSGGKAQRYLLRFIETAAELKIAVVSCGTFRNTGSKREDLAEEEKLLARFREVLPQMEAHVAHDPRRMIMGGPSGGAWRAFHYAAWVERPWLGIFSNGGWLGREEYWDLPYPAMRVAIVNGNLDHANRVVESDVRILTGRGCAIAVFSFEGGHQEAPVAHTTEALRWILEDDDHTRGNNPG